MDKIKEKTMIYIKEVKKNKKHLIIKSWSRFSHYIACQDTPQRNFSTQAKPEQPALASSQFGLTPFLVIFFLILWFMVFKLTCSDSWFQQIICTESRDISQNVSNFGGLVRKGVFLQFLVISLNFLHIFLNQFLC